MNQNSIPGIIGSNKTDITSEIIDKKDREREDNSKRQAQEKQERQEKIKVKNKQKREEQKRKQSEQKAKNLETAQEKQKAKNQKREEKKQAKILLKQEKQTATAKSRISKMDSTDGQTTLTMKNNKTISFENINNKMASGKTIIKKKNKTIELVLKDNKIDGDIMIDKKSKKVFVKKNPKENEPQVIIEKYNKSKELIQITEVHRFVNNKAEGKVVVKDLKKNQETHCYAVNGVISGPTQHIGEENSITCDIVNGKKQGEAILFQHRNQQVTKLNFKDDKLADKMTMQTPHTKQSYKVSKEGNIKNPKLLFYLKLPWLVLQTIFNFIKRCILRILKATSAVMISPYTFIKWIIKKVNHFKKL